MRPDYLIPIDKKVNRIEVIDDKGRSYTNYNVTSSEMSYQDDGRTLKIFVTSKVQDHDDSCN